MAHVTTLSKEAAVAPRLYVEDTSLAAQASLSLLEGAARHVQVLRLQPGDEVTLFDGRGGEWLAQVTHMGRKEVQVAVKAHVAVSRELPVHVTLAVGMPANDRMDALVEKATELGVAAIQPLVCERSVLRLDGDRATKKVAHWQGVAVAASEQSGRTAVPRIAPVMPLKAWLGQAPMEGARALLSFAPDTQLMAWCQGYLVSKNLGHHAPMLFLSGPEGGLSPAEEQLARTARWTPVGLGTRVLRADTAPLMALSCVAALLASG